MDFKYDVFISYKHAPLDMAVSGKLQKILEHYHVPREIQKKGKKRLSRVFRDNEELSAGADLNAEISAQLEQSEFLIVVCSPDSAQSYWVDREIRTFVSMHGSKNVIPLLIAGEPDEAFPHPLKELGEPLAVDIRAKKGGGKKEVLRNLKRELTRLTAPVLHCSYDELKQRHKVYQYRRIAAATAAVLALACAFLAYVFYEYRQLNSAYNELQYKDSQNLTVRAAAAFDANDPVQAAQYALEALNNGDIDDDLYDPAAQLVLSQAVGCYENGINTEDSLVVTGKIIFPEEISTDCFCLNDDGSLLLAFSKNKLYVYQTSDSTLIRTIDISDSSNYKDPDTYALFDEERILLVTDECLQCVNYTNGESVWKVRLPENEEAGYFSDDRTEFVCATDSRLYTIDTADGTITNTIPIGLPEAYGTELESEWQSFSSDGAYLLIKDKDGKALLVNTADGIGTLLPYEASENINLRWISDRVYMVLSGDEQAANTKVIFVDVENGIVGSEATLNTNSSSRSYLRNEGILVLGQSLYHIEPTDLTITSIGEMPKSLQKIFDSDDDTFYAVAYSGTLYRCSYDGDYYAMSSFGRSVYGTAEKDDVFYVMEDSMGSTELFRYEIGPYDDHFADTGLDQVDYSSLKNTIAWDGGLASWDESEAVLQLIDLDGSIRTVELPEEESLYDYDFLGMFDDGIHVSYRHAEFMSDESWIYHLYVIDPEDGSVKTVETEEMDPDGTCVSFVNRGTKIWADRSVDDGYQIVIYDYITGEVNTLDMEGNLCLEGIEPDDTGDKALIHDSRQLWIYILNADGEMTGKVDLADWTRDEVNNIGYDKRLIWNASGTMFAAVGTNRLEVYDLEGKLVTTAEWQEESDDLYFGENRILFSEDNRYVYYVGEDTLSRFQLDGSQEAETTGLPVSMSTCYQSVERDGQLIILNSEAAVVVRADETRFRQVDLVPNCSYYDSLHDRFYFLGYKWTDNQEYISSLCYYERYTLEEEIQMAREKFGGSLNEEE